MSKIVVPCDSKDKARWTLAAKANNVGLVEWVNTTLNDAVKDMSFPPPRWMKGFNSELSYCLVDAKITRKADLIALIDSGAWRWDELSNFNQEYYDEVLAWRNELVL